MISDREKVIKGLECCNEYAVYNSECKEECPYLDVNRYCCVEDLIKDALTLLKEQEAKPMIENEIGWNCPSCGMKLIEKTASGYPCNLIDLPEDEPIHFCPMCGQAVKWE